MLVLIAIVLALIPAVAIAYPLLRSKGHAESPQDESSTGVELARRWDAALAGLKAAELEWSLGNLSDEDYRWLREQHMTEAALVMKAMELEEEEEQRLLNSVQLDVQSARRSVLDPADQRPDAQDAGHNG